MEPTNLYHAIRVMTLPMVLSLAAGEPPKFTPTMAWKAATETAPTLKVPASKPAPV